MLFKSVKVLVFICISSFLIHAQNKYQFAIDLINVQNDQIKVTLKTPKIETRKALYMLPSVVPGTYSKYDFGRYVENFKAFDKNGKELPVKRDGDNLFYIKKAKNLDKIEYYVNDTWDAPNNKPFVFQPGGSNIESGKNYALNSHCLFGYFDGLKTRPFEITINKPAEMYGSSPLKKKQVNTTQDILYADSYMRLADSPFMYCKPDTANFKVGNMAVQISAYSPNGLVDAAWLANLIKPMGEALGKFFGGKLPVDNYNFIFYFAGSNQMVNQDPGTMSGFGALEHSYSSFYYLPEMQGDHLTGMVNEVCAHEFMHILTPLNLHSYEIGDFDFRNPKMSKHLWMYEGTTEYFAQLVLVRGGITTPEDFMKNMREKMLLAEKFDPISFTKMSAAILDKNLQDDYLNVYQKGALIGFGLDVLIMQKSKGKKGWREVMLQLAKKYGPKKPFEDDKLIDEIVKMTYPEVRTYFEKYVIGNQPIDFSGILPAIGWEYLAEAEVEKAGYGDFSIGFGEGKLMFVNVGENPLGIQEKDALKKINGQELSFENAMVLLQSLFISAEMKQLSITVERNGQDVELSGNPTVTRVKEKNIVRPMANPTAEQKKLADSFFQGINIEK